MNKYVLKELTKPLNYLLLIPTFLVWWLMMQTYQSANFDMVSTVCWYMAVMSLASILVGCLNKQDLSCVAILGVMGFVFTLLSVITLKVFMTSEFASIVIFPPAVWLTFKQSSVVILYAIEKGKEDA